jgi:hypothetical protein
MVRKFQLMLTSLTIFVKHMQCCAPNVRNNQREHFLANDVQRLVLNIILFLICLVAATTATKKTKHASDNSDEPPYRRTRNKINSLARVLQIEHSLYQDDLVMRLGSLSDQINTVDKHVDDLRLDLRSMIHDEFMYLIQKMLLPKRQQQQQHHSDNSVEIDVGGRS